MKKIISIFTIVIILGIMFAGCDTKEVAVENDEFYQENVIVEDVITENIIVEDIIVEDIIEETIWVSPEYQSELEFNSIQNEF